MKRIDTLYQAAYRIAFQVLRVCWFVTRPRHHGALVLIWHEGALLLLRNSYHPLWSLPGGGVDSGESARAAAVREIREELGVNVAVTDLRDVAEITLPFRHRTDRVTLFAWHAEARPVLSIDNREVVDAQWFTAEEALRLRLVPHLVHYLAKRRSDDGDVERDGWREGDISVRHADVESISTRAANQAAHV